MNSKNHKKFNEFFLLGLLLFVVSCHSSQTKIIHDTKSTDKYESLLSLFKDTVLKPGDTFHIYSPANDNDQMNGVVIDERNASLLPKELRAESSIKEPTLFALFKFPLDKDDIALVLRSPSQYESTSISIVAYNINTHSFAKYLWLADAIGDRVSDASLADVLKQLAPDLVIPLEVLVGLTSWRRSTGSSKRGIKLGSRSSLLRSKDRRTFSSSSLA